MENKNTPLLEEHEDLKAKIASFGGWNMPIQYTSIITEHNWTRENCSIFDICHMGEFMIYGDPVQTGIDNILTQDFKNADDNTCHYGFMLNKNAGIIDDVIIYKIEKDKFMLVVNAATTVKDEQNLMDNLHSGAIIENISEKTAKIDVQGPMSADVVEQLAGAGIRDLKYYRFGFYNVLGENVIISRTGYTGELGFEIYIKTEKAVELWQTLLKDTRVKPAGLGARDTLRLEMSYPLYGHELDDQTTPYEAGLDRFVDMDKDFIGKSKLQENTKKKLCCFVTDSRRSPRHGHKIFKNNKQIGFVTSGSFSPSIGFAIGMGYVEKKEDEINNEIVIKDDRMQINAKIVKRPFYKQGTFKIELA
ncbi:MAG: glycine cleavage system aminomethyltransferase GcvT [Candidatus Omnitrophica bacterium]|nr:glycine cleavage system aminomethyltransferase GcvT [Candidatus Omnitrophota bacterium]